MELKERLTQKEKELAAGYAELDRVKLQQGEITKVVLKLEGAVLVLREALEPPKEEAPKKPEAKK